MKTIISIVVTVLFASTLISAQESTDTTITKEKKVEFNVFGSITFANVNEATRVGKAIGPYGLNIAPFVQLNMKTRRTSGWYVWAYKPVNPLDVRSFGNYMQFAIGKKIKLGKYAVLNPHISYFVPQHQYFLKYEQTSWIFACIGAVHLSRKSAENPKRSHMLNFFINRFENPNGIGSDWNVRIGLKKSIEYLTFELKAWYNNGLFESDPGFNGALTITTDQYPIAGKRVYLQGSATAFVNFTRNTDNPFTTDAAVVGLIIGYK